jgi:signal peptidase I
MLAWFGLAVALSAWFALLAPTALGGRTTYLVSHGISMQPRFHTGDLAVIRPAANYRVGEVAAYRSRVLRTVVLHRIVAVAHGHYTFKGDHNNWLDPERPTRAQMIGTLVARIPAGGIWLHRLAGPPGLGLLAFVLIAGGGTATTRRRRRSRTMPRHAGPLPPPVALSWLPMPLRGAITATAIIGALSLALGAFAWTRPTTREVSRPAKADRSVTFSYSAAVPPSAAYDTTTVRSPQPIFRRLTDTINIGYVYRGAPGTVSAAAIVSAPSGWQTRIPLAGPTRFTADRYHGDVVLHLGRIDARAEAAAKVTGLPADQLLVAVTLTIRTARGSLFTPALDLTVTPLQASLANGTAGLSVASTTTLPANSRQVRALALFGHQLAVPTARTISAAALLLALLAAALIAFSARRSTPASEAERIRRRYASLLLTVQPMPTPAGHAVVDVTRFNSLVRLAERYGLLVLHWTRADTDTFVVHDHDTTYRYRAGQATPTLTQLGPVQTSAAAATLREE